jgi:hypothetical protein
MFRVPTMSGIRYTPMPSMTGTANRNIMATPCVVKIWLYRSGPRNVLPGTASCSRTSAASSPARMKNENALTR